MFSDRIHPMAGPSLRQPGYFAWETKASSLVDTRKSRMRTHSSGEAIATDEGSLGKRLRVSLL